MTQPQITVLMPVYNAEKYLREAIDSVLNQTFTAFELLIINDGSTDTSEQIIQSYTDPRIRYIKNDKNLRLIATLNKGIGLITTKYMVRADADDINIPERLELQYRYMEEHPEIGLLGTAFELFGENVSPAITRYSADHNTICLKHLYQIHLSHGTSIFRMSVLKENNLLFDPSFSHAEDYELWTRISAVTRLANLQQVLYRVRIHENEVSKIHSSTQLENSFRVKKREFEKMGLQVTEEDIKMYTRIAQFEYTPDKKFVTATGILLEKMVVANNKSRLIDTAFFTNQMCNFWFNATYNSGLGWWALRQYQQSALGSKMPLTLVQKIKFIIKGIV